MYYNIEADWPISVCVPVEYRLVDSEYDERLCPFYHLNIERNVYEENSNIWIN